jgi:hypothetical protein
VAHAGDARALFAELTEAVHAGVPDGTPLAAVAALRSAVALSHFAARERAWAPFCVVRGSKSVLRLF